MNTQELSQAVLEKISALYDNEAAVEMFDMITDFLSILNDENASDILINIMDAVKYAMMNENVHENLNEFLLHSNKYLMSENAGPEISTITEQLTEFLSDPEQVNVSNRRTQKWMSMINDKNEVDFLQRLKIFIDNIVKDPNSVNIVNTVFTTLNTYFRLNSVMPRANSFRKE